MANFPQRLDPRQMDPRRWAGEPDMIPVYAMVVCLIVGALILLLGAAARI
ncbi:MAG: hypothetical protein ABI740_06835 [Alphaproteobacteria bacterium]